MIDAPEAITDRAHYRTLAAAIEHLVEHWRDQPDLGDLAARAGLSPGHFQRLFTRWVGISPKRFLQFLTLDEAKRRLDANQGVLETALDVGLSGPSRLHDLFLVGEAVTPGAYKAAGAGVTLRWGLFDSPFGRVLAARSERGLCRLVFAQDDAVAVAELARDWPAARLIEDADALAPALARAFGWAAADAAPPSLHARGTNFQIKVWEALLRIPPGALVAYGDVARAIGRPTAQRAVGAAIGLNPIAVLIPCHRVIRKSGVIHNYRYGVTRKRALLAWEQARLADGGDGDGADANG